MEEELKNKIVYLRGIYNPTKELYIKFEEDYSNIYEISESDIINSISITSKMEYEDEITLNLTKEILSTYNKGNLNLKNKESIRITNLYNAYRILNDHINKRLTLDLILELHNNIMLTFNNKMPGMLRDGPVYIGDGPGLREFISYKEVLKEMKILIEKYNNVDLLNDNYSLLNNICELKKEFIKIHPFKDGNGRISRMLFQKQLIELNLPFTVFDNWVREDYHEIMGLSVETGRVNLLTDFVLYNMYNKIELYDKIEVDILDKNEIKHKAFKTNRKGVYYSTDIKQLIYGKEMQENIIYWK